MTRRAYQPSYPRRPAPDRSHAAFAGNVGALTAVATLIALAPTLAVLATLAKPQENAK